MTYLAKTKKLLLLLILVAIFCFGLEVKALAASAYNTDSSNPCNSGDVHLDIQTYDKGGKSYYCIEGTQKDDLVAPVNGKCPSGYPAANVFGVFCYDPAKLSVQGAGLDPLKAPTGGHSGKFCGGDDPQNKDSRIETSIDLGCRGQGNGILDLLFAVIRFLSIGVGLVIIASLIVAGIQYTASRGDPQATAAAIKRAANTFAALVLFIFIYAIINYLVPGAILK